VFSVKNILRIEKFDFEDGKSPPRDKYMLVLHVNGPGAIIAPLTTSVDTITDHYKANRCIKDDPNNIHCYYIPKKLVIGQKGFAFHKDTFIHIHSTNLKNRNLAKLQARYVDTKTVELKDILTDSEFCDLLYCIYKSKHVPRGVKDALETAIEALERQRAGLA